MARQKYFKTRQEASKAAREYGLMGYQGLGVWKMPKGTRKAGMFAVCSEIEFLNTY